MPYTEGVEVLTAATWWRRTGVSREGGWSWECGGTAGTAGGAGGASSRNISDSGVVENRNTHEKV